MKEEVVIGPEEVVARKKVSKDTERLDFLEALLASGDIIKFEKNRIRDYQTNVSELKYQIFTFRSKYQCGNSIRELIDKIKGGN